MLTNLTNAIWWRDAALRGLYTAVAIAIPYIGGSLVADVPWLAMLSAAAVGFIASIAMSLFGLPEVEGVNLPWWLAAVERVVKTFFQALAAGIAPATFLTDVDWSTVLQASLIAAGLSLLRLILATLPADPTRVPIDAGEAGSGRVANITVVAGGTGGLDAAAAATEIRRALG